MKHTFHIEVISARTTRYCDESLAEGVHLWGPIKVRDRLEVLVELTKPVPADILAPFIISALSACQVARVCLFDETIPFTREQLRAVLSKQSKLGA